MSEKELSPNQKKLKLRNEALDKFEARCGLPSGETVDFSDELEEYLLMTRDVLEKQSADSLYSMAARISQIIFFLQRSCNREDATHRWAEEELVRATATEMAQMDSYKGKENNLALVCKQNSAANELKQMSVYAKQRSIRLNGLADRLSSFAMNLSMMAKNKREN